MPSIMHMLRVRVYVGFGSIDPRGKKYWTAGQKGHRHEIFFRYLRLAQKKTPRIHIWYGI